MRQSKPQFNNNQLSGGRIAIIVAQWNADYNEEMFASARDTLLEAGLLETEIEKFSAPGAFEIPLLAQQLAETGDYDAIICFATVIKGATRHFEIVADESTRGLMDAMLNTNVAILNGILACNDTEQAGIRASRSQEDKGREVALSAIALLSELSKIEDLNSAALN